MDWEESEDEPAPVKKETAPKSIMKKKTQPEEDETPAPAKVSRAVQERLDQDEGDSRIGEKVGQEEEGSRRWR